MKLNSRQIALVDAQIKRLIQTDSYYGKMYKEAGIDGISCQEDFEKLPFSSKADLRNAYPLGIQAVPDEEVVRIHSSSGTTGKPVIIPYTAKDVDDWATMFARCYETAGITKKTVSRLHRDMVCGQPESDFRPDVRNWVRWQFRWDRAILINRFR